MENGHEQNRRGDRRLRIHHTHLKTIRTKI